MFNRHIQVKLTKSTPDAPYDQSKEDLEAKLAVISKHVERGIRKIGHAVIAYVVIDTARQVLIAQAKKK